MSSHCPLIYIKTQPMNSDDTPVMLVSFSERGGIQTGKIKKNNLVAELFVKWANYKLLFPNDSLCLNQELL